MHRVVDAPAGRATTVEGMIRMISGHGLQYRVAAAEWEFEQIHRLNYRTFVEEIPQHPPNAERRLVDKFHAENTYGICVRDGRVVGMLAWRARRPFSLDQKLAELDAYLPPGRKPCEIRLLAVEKECRRGPVFHGLLALLAENFTRQGHDLALITGVLKQGRLYRRLGFVPFGPVLGSGAATFQPMQLSLERFAALCAESGGRWVPGELLKRADHGTRG